MSTENEVKGAEFILKLEGLRQELDPNNCLVRQAAELYTLKGLNCTHANYALKVFWVKNRHKILEIIKELSDLASRLPGDDALDSDTFNYALALKHLQTKTK